MTSVHSPCIELTVSSQQKCHSHTISFGVEDISCISAIIKILQNCFVFFQHVSFFILHTWTSFNPTIHLDGSEIYILVCTVTSIVWPDRPSFLLEAFTLYFSSFQLPSASNVMGRTFYGCYDEACPLLDFACISLDTFSLAMVCQPWFNWLYLWDFFSR